MPGNDVTQLHEVWEGHGREDPLWAILTESEKRSGKWDQDAFFATGIAEVEALLGRLRHVAPTLAFDRALDFGCGVGRLTEALADHFQTVDGVDISESMVRRGADLSRHPETVRYHANTRSDLQMFDADTFSLVHSSIVLQHVGRRLARQYIAEFVRVARPDGVVHFQLPTTPRLTPAGLVLRFVPDRVLDRARGMRMQGMPEREVVALLTGLGLDVLDVAPDDSAGPRWNSRRYTARKPA